MKKAFLINVVFLSCMVLFATSVFAADGGTTPRFKPSISIGYAFAGSTDLSFDSVDGGALLGVSKFDYDIPNFSGVYVAGDFLFNFSDRLSLSFGVKGTAAFSDEEMSEMAYGGGSYGGRNFNSDRRDWYTVDLLASYAFIKDASFLKNLSAVAGLRYDYHKMSFDNPQPTAGSLLTAPADTIDFKMQTYSPVLGIMSTLQGFKSGIFGGDIKLSLLGSPIVFGKIDYTEVFGGTTSTNVDDEFNRCYFFNIGAEITAISAKIGPRADLTVSLFGQYTRFVIDDDITMTGNTGATQDFNFTMSPNSAVVGIKTAIEF